MFQKRQGMEQMVAWVLMAYAIGLVLGQTLRSHLFPETSRKYKLSSSLFTLLKLRWSFSHPEFRKLLSLALQTFHSIALPVQTFV